MKDSPLNFSISLIIKSFLEKTGTLRCWKWKPWKLGWRLDWVSEWVGWWAAELVGWSSLNWTLISFPIENWSWNPNFSVSVLLSSSLKTFPCSAESSVRGYWGWRISETNCEMFRWDRMDRWECWRRWLFMVSEKDPDLKSWRLNRNGGGTLE